MSKESTGPLWRMPTVEAYVGLSKGEIYKRIKLGTFPNSLKLGSRAVAWKKSDIEAFISSLIQQGAK
jgi:prophage regulatory protein